eukprot:TRINITY_DN26403_c0_g1_i3.p1 TRINITY_DN26403_c0_g1~~TRINITY_DN26403_c0_g1_i3.p1  ORF type:complete len:314 (+),score=55.42 TRINITY_DN26403_c0_g1_i3:94-1035(+)
MLRSLVGSEMCIRDSYKDSPVYANDYTGARDKRSPKVNIVWAIRRCIISLRDPLESPLEQAIALRILIHLLGDLHQPLHNSELYSAAFPNGDMGGNNVKVRTIAGERLNLHKFWDSGGGPTTGIFKDSPYCCYPHYNRDPAFVHYLMAKVDVLAATHVAEHVLSNSTINVEGWHMEGWELAVQSVYPGAFLHGGNLTALYTQDAVEILERQIRIAGVRLGKVLDYALGEDNGDDDAIDGTLLISIQIIVSFIVLAMFLGWKRCGADSPAPPAGSTPLPSNEPPGVDLPDLGSTQQLTIMMPVGSVPLVDHSTL